MKSYEKSTQEPSTEDGNCCLVMAILESGLSLRDWCLYHEKRVSEASDTVLRELAGNQELRAQVLGCIDHSAARVFHETGEQQFDRFAGTIFAMQTLSRGLDEKHALEALSIELLDPFIELRQQGKVTRKWLSALLSRKCKAGGRVYRFGELSRIALLAASLLGYHDKDLLFIWALENREGIEGLTPRRWSRVMSSVFEDAGYPRFDLWQVSDHEKAVVRRVHFDTDSLFCRRLLKDSTNGSVVWGDALYAGRRFCAEFTQSLGFTPEGLSDFTVETFMRQARWFESKPNANEHSHRLLCMFYRYVIACLPDNQNQFTFDTGLPPQLLDDHHLLQLWLDGYRAVQHNPLCPVPEYDKWIVFPPSDSSAKQNACLDPVALNLSVYERRITAVLKEWVWYECKNVYDAKWLLPELSRLFDLIVRSAGWQRIEPKIDVEPVARYVDKQLGAFERSTILCTKSCIKSILRYGEATGRWQVEESVYLLLDVDTEADGRILA